jgi:uncharacterized circularly permuted ATP-grasp superfamily protein
VASEPVSDYNRLVADDPGAVEQARWLEAAFGRRGIRFGDLPMRTFLRPHLVARDDWGRLRDAGRRLLGLAARLARQAFGGDVGRLCAYLGTPEAEVPWVAHDPGPPDVLLSRLDAFLTPEGPRFIEINSDAPAGFGYGDQMAEVFRQLPAFQAFAHDRPVSYIPSGTALVEAVQRAWQQRGGPGPPVVAIVDFAGVKTRADQELLAEAFQARGMRCRLADPREVELRAGRPWLGALPLDVVYRRALLQELLERADEVRPLLEAYRAGAALFVNSFRCRLSEDKAFFALMTDEAFSSLLSEEERAFVGRHVPWTRRVEERKTLRDGRSIDLVPWILEHRSALVLKPAHGYGGQSVFVGDETPLAEWEAALGAALDAPWVVQERVAIPEEEFPVVESGRLAFEPLKVNVNPFWVAGAEVGAVTRASRSSVINVSAGGGSVPSFVVG